MIPAAGVDGRRIGVLGLGRSGLAAARAIAAGGGAPICGDDGEPRRAAARALGFETADLSDPEILRGVDRLLISPGVPHLYPAPHPAAAAAAAIGLPLDNDVGLFFETLSRSTLSPRPRTVAVTGSNGKSTTAALIHHLLQIAGRPAQLGGNIGRGVFDLDPPQPGEIFVLELSSYQTDLAARLSPDVAALTNLSPDHLDRHGGLGGYFAAKRRLFDGAGIGLSIVGVDETEGRFLAQSLASRPAPGLLRRVSVEDALAGDPRAVIMEGDTLVVRGAEPGEARFDLSALDRLPGRHNHQNIAVAVAAVLHLGLRPDEIRAGLERFGGLAHRLQKILEIRGVAFVNDSKATNAEATEKALAAFSRIRWIAGGRAKQGGVERLRPLFSRIAKAYLIGECADAFAATLGMSAPHEICGDVETAVIRAAAEAAPGETILLSPAAASFDQFPDFEARGRAFEAAAARLASA